MKGMKGKFLKKLKSVKQISYNPDRILQQVTSFDGFVDKFPLKSTLVDNFSFKCHNKPQQCSPPLKPTPPQKQEVVNVEELIKDLQEEVEEEENLSKEINTHCDFDDKENKFPSTPSKESEKQKKGDLEIERSRFRRPDMNSCSLFDPNLLAAFQEAIKEYLTTMEASNLETISKNHKYPFFQPEDQPDPLTESEQQPDPLLEFEEKCPPGGGNSVILYTTSLRGIRKTFEDCQSIRFLLESFGLVYYERDVSIHSEFRDEMWRVMGEKCLPPLLFVRGRYIGGAEKVLTLNEQGRLRPLFRDIPINFNEGPCNVCSGLRFILCYNCNGSRKVFQHHDNDGDGDGDGDVDEEGSHGGGLWIKCSQCNENGLVVCPLC